MAIYRPIAVAIWDDPVFRKYSNNGKLLFLYLITNRSCSESGIYRLPIDKAAFECKMSEEAVSNLLQGELSGNPDTMKGNIWYDAEEEVVFVKNFLKYNGRGNRDRLMISISNDYTTTSSSLWELFAKQYPYVYKHICRNRNSIRNRNSNSPIVDNIADLPLLNVGQESLPEDQRMTPADRKKFQDEWMAAIGREIK